MTADRLLDLLPMAGVTIYLERDSRLVVRGPSAILDALQPQLRAVGRDAIRAELERQATASRARLAALLDRRVA
jgi:hypothetical protein